MTKGTADLLQVTDAVACREYTLPREEEALNQNDGSKEIGPVLEVATSLLAR